MKTLISIALCLALSPVVAFAQDDEKPAPKKEKSEKKESKEKKKAPATPRDEEAALKEFKADMKKLKEWTKSKKETETNPAAGLRLITEMNEKLSAIRTDGLPGDLATGFGEMTELIGKMAGYFDDAPKEDDEFQAWLVKKSSDPEFVKQMQEEMPKLGKEIEAKGTELKEIGAKYGLKEELDLDDKDKKDAKGDDDGEEKEEGDDKEEKEEKEEK